MLYVSNFESDPTKSFTQVAMHNIKALQQQNVNFEIRSLNNVIHWSQFQNWIQELNPYFSDAQSDTMSAIVHLLPQDLNSTFYKGKTTSIAYTTFETTLMVKWIVDALNKNYKGMIVPSEFNKQALIASGAEIPIEVVHHCLHPMYLNDVPSPAEREKDTYIFGYIGSFNARKNPRAVLDTYLKTFPKGSNTRLLIKTYRAGDLESYVESVCGENRDDVWIYDEQWTEPQMLWAYSMIDCFVSAHKGEGFGLALAQSAALGKPVIYTDFSAPTEWLSEDKGHYPVRCTVESVNSEDVTASYAVAYDSSLEWATIDLEHLAERMQFVVDHNVCTGFNKEDLASFREMLSWKTIGENFVKAYETIFKAPILRKEQKAT
jgi:glycosyltransferase involved in cell wall biosynthesis